MSLIMKIVCLLTLSAGLFVITDGIEIDPFGYIMYCPCMGMLTIWFQDAS